MQPLITGGIFGWALVAAVLWFNEPDLWDGIVYPDRNNLLADRFVGQFDTWNACRLASLDMLEQLNAVDTGDYECGLRSEEHTSELQSLMRISYAVFCLKKKKKSQHNKK